MPATDGKAIVAGSTCSISRSKRNGAPGYLPETPPLYPDMTVAELPDVRRQDQACRRRSGSASGR